MTRLTEKNAGETKNEGDVNPSFHIHTAVPAGIGSGLPSAGEKYEGTAEGCYACSDTNTGRGFLSADAFAAPASFPGWDFENVWTLENGIRPVLRNNPET